MNKLYALLLLLPFFCRGQDSLNIIPVKDTSVISTDTSHSKPIAARNLLRKDVWRVDILDLGYLNEHRLGKQLSLVSQIRLVGSFRNEDRVESNGSLYGYTFKKVLAFSINPELSVAVRHFYNLAKRKATGRSIRYNSGCYFAVKANYVAPPIYNNSNIDIQGLGATVFWGVQHTQPKHFYVNLEIGVGMAQYYENTISPTANLILGYTF
ncbi:hypothetical protein [Spirosoma sp. KNUC1025]|uniref:hypothetical protein n=1 Tax=Spirosoma sp. KNUC1025 TaxID=2894082 RepID=UPI00386F2FA1|nr:hypothetical protein LN737_16420 [Spirosoma sp. KNUC1025]